MVLLDARKQHTQMANCMRTSSVAPEPTTGDKKRHMCQLCESGVITQWCTDCTSWLCDNCAQAHTNIKVTSSHRLLSMSKARKAVRRDIREAKVKLDKRIDEHKAAREAYARAIEDTQKVTSQARQECLQWRADARKHIDEYFDSLDQNISDFDKKSTTELQHYLTQVTSKLGEIHQQRSDLTKTKCRHTTESTVEAQHVLQRAQELLSPMTSPDVDIVSAAVKLYPKPIDWKQIEPVTLETSGGNLVRQ